MLFHDVPRTSPRLASSQAAGSSAHAPSCCGPRSCSGFSELYVVAIAPLGHVNRRTDGFHVGRKSLGEQDRMPDSPSIITSRTSPGVRLIKANRRRPPRRTWSITHSAIARVLPEPRPAMNAQTSQSPSGGSWSGRAIPSQSGGGSSAGDSLSATCPAIVS